MCFPPNYSTTTTHLSKIAVSTADQRARLTEPAAEYQILSFALSTFLIFRPQPRANTLKGAGSVDPFGPLVDLNSQVLVGLGCAGTHPPLEAFICLIRGILVYSEPRLLCKEAFIASFCSLTLPS